MSCYLHPLASLFQNGHLTYKDSWLQHVLLKSSTIGEIMKIIWMLVLLISHFALVYPELFVIIVRSCTSVITVDYSAPSKQGLLPYVLGTLWSRYYYCYVDNSLGGRSCRSRSPSPWEGFSEYMSACFYYHSCCWAFLRLVWYDGHDWDTD